MVNQFIEATVKFRVTVLLLDGCTNCWLTSTLYRWLWSHAWNLLSDFILLLLNCTLEGRIALLPACRDPISFQDIRQVRMLDVFFGSHVKHNALIGGVLFDITRLTGNLLLLELERINSINQGLFEVL